MSATGPSCMSAVCLVCLSCWHPSEASEDGSDHDTLETRNVFSWVRPPRAFDMLSGNSSAFICVPTVHLGTVNLLPEAHRDFVPRSRRLATSGRVFLGFFPHFGLVHSGRFWRVCVAASTTCNQRTRTLPAIAWNLAPCRSC